MNKYHLPLEDGAYYHVYNRANGSEKLFIDSDDYDQFLRMYQQYISPVADTFCHCLMPNHFHLMLRIKPEADIQAYFRDDSEISALVSEQFKRLFSSYVISFNFKWQRKGSLFMKNYKRIRITTDSYLTSLTLYIHNNPVECNLCASRELWRYSSYREITMNKIPSAVHAELIDLFGGLENFIAAHDLFQSTPMPD